MVLLPERKSTVWTTIFYEFVTCRSCRSEIRKRGSLSNYAYIKAKEGGEIGTLPRGATYRETIEHWRQSQSQRIPPYAKQIQKAVEEGARPHQGEEDFTKAKKGSQASSQESGQAGSQEGGQAGSS
jgi:hypothetical protein